MKNEEDIIEKINIEFEKIGSCEPYSYSERMPNYKMRENIKMYGWQLYSIALSKEEYRKASSAIVECVIWSHYWRCRQSLENLRLYKAKIRKIMGKACAEGYHLEFDHYAKNWLHSNSRCLDPKVVEALCEKYGYQPVASEYMGLGKTYYTL